MQQMTPQEGHRFPDNPQPPSAPRFASNAPQARAQSYEPQTRMQNTGSFPVVQPSPYAAGQLQPLHGEAAGPTPRIPLMPADSLRLQIPATCVQGTPLWVYTDKGTPVAITDMEMKRALADHAAQSGQVQEEQESQQQQKQKRRQKKELRGKKEQTGKFVMKFSLTWCVFGVIGIISTALTVYEWVIVPLLVWLNQLTGG